MIKIKGDNTHENYKQILEELRLSGITNMFGATPFLEARFKLSKEEARKILADWMKNYNKEDYK